MSSVKAERLRVWLDAYARAFVGRDGDAAAALFADDATYQGPDGRCTEFREWWNKQESAPAGS
jgi:hypothetical protein